MKKISDKNKTVASLFNCIRCYQDTDHLIFSDGTDWFWFKHSGKGTLNIKDCKGKVFPGFTEIIRLEKIPKSEYPKVFDDCSPDHLAFFNTDI